MRKRSASRNVTANLFAGDSTVHRFDANDRQSISALFAGDSPMSALICGDTETVLSHLPDCAFQTCVVFVSVAEIVKDFIVNQDAKIAHARAPQQDNARWSDLLQSAGCCS